MTIREKMARAICHANCSIVMTDEEIECQVENGWDLWLKETDAALSVLTNPDDETVERVRLAWEKAKVPYRLSDHEATRLLLAALKEEV